MKNRLFKILAFGAWLVGLTGCYGPKTRPFAPPPAEMVTLQSQKKSGMDIIRCNDWRHYVPDTLHPDHQPLRYLRVNVHVMDSRDSSHNFRADAARAYFRALIDTANAQLAENWRNWQSPLGTPTLPKGYRYVLWPQPGVPGDDGFYFHYDDSLYYFISQGKNQNNYDRKVIDKYAVGKDSIINIFTMVHPDDSIRSPTYRAKSQGIALGTALKLAGNYELKWPPQMAAPSTNHEIGHLLSLNHAWSEDGCPDTKNHPNRCWEWTPDPPCDALATNNMMDYNAYANALTPCQIGRIHATLSTEKNQMRRCLVPNWCERDPARDVVIRDSVAWRGARDLDGSLTIAAGGTLHLFCRLSMPAGSRITVEPGGTLWLDGARLHNACGRAWEGIWVKKQGKKSGQVRVLQAYVIENVATK